VERGAVLQGEALRLQVGRRTMCVDLDAEQLITASRGPVRTVTPRRIPASGSGPWRALGAVRRTW
jgi:hypothetical protein